MQCMDPNLPRNNGKELSSWVIVVVVFALAFKQYNHSNLHSEYAAHFQGEISLEEQAELARKTLGAFGLDEVSASGSVCDELFVPSAPAPPVLLPHHSSGGTVSADSLSREREEAGGSTSESDTGVAADAEGEASLGIPSAATAAATADGDKDDDSRRGLEGGPTSSRRAEEHESAMPSSEGVQKIVGQQRQGAEQRQMSVFKVEDFVFPGMTRRFRIFEPRYRALVKRCLSEGEPLVILPLSKGGNTVGTAAYVSGLHNVEEDGRQVGSTRVCTYTHYARACVRACVHAFRW